jgi:2-keto-4-pentenoate hydratase/2-oxohepta-3-ene-1,7-dioic acid hydratase in catechol pathway
VRIARWRDAVGQIGEGFVAGDRLVPFPDAMTVSAVLALGLPKLGEIQSRTDAAASVPLKDAVLLPPLVPASIRDFVAFEEHVEGVSAAIDGTSHVPDEWYEAPTFYFTNPHTVLGHDETMTPPVTERLDFELEVAAIVGGAGGSNLTVEAAEAAIFGYTVMNDWSARDIQGREMQVRLGPAKGKDFATSLGPWIVTKDELDPFVDSTGALAIRAQVFVNDELIGEDLVSNMGWTFADLVAYASRNSRVVAGDVLGSGTVGNGGCLAELWGRRGTQEPRPLRAGDTVRMVVEGIGVLTGEVGQPSIAPPVPRASPRRRLRVRPEDSR